MRIDERGEMTLSGLNDCSAIMIMEVMAEGQYSHKYKFCPPLSPSLYPSLSLSFSLSAFISLSLSLFLSLSIPLSSSTLKSLQLSFSAKMRLHYPEHHSAGQGYRQ